ncbi:MAG: sodium:solute symporter family protein [Planctomycetota bacterium]
MELHVIDWTFIICFFVVALLIGIWVSRQAGKDKNQFFLSGRNMPWWLLGMSMVATTFSTDTPNLVTDIVRQRGVAGNWVWWAFLLTGMLTVFVYAKLWRRSGVLTDVEFYEIRYSGRSAAFLRGFRSLYLGIIFNVMIMAAVTLAAIKIGGVMLGFSPLKTILLASVITVTFSTLGGFKGVLLTDFLLFILAMAGSIAAAVIAVQLPEVGGLEKLLSHENVRDKLALFPAFDFGSEESTGLVISVLIIPLAVQWWSVWYPGSEPGGGGYIAQRMLAARTEKHAMGATLFFNIAHYALRPWPWILVALCSLIVFPDLESLRSAFPHVDPDVVRHDLAYPAMLTFLPSGMLGLVLASLIAAYMSTISTQLNLGSSYLVNDFYHRFIRREAPEKELVMAGRIATVLLMVLAGGLALVLSNALEAFNILLQIGAGTGLLFILRWFWWRINAWSEISAMVISFLIALYFQFLHESLFPDMPMADHWRLAIGVGVTTAGWIAITLFTPPTEEATLRSFYCLTRPGGPGWERICRKARSEGQPLEAGGKGWTVPLGIVCMFAGCLLVYCALFATGYFLYGKVAPGVVLSAIAAAAAVFLGFTWSRVS